MENDLPNSISANREPQVALDPEIVISSTIASPTKVVPIETKNPKESLSTATPLPVAPHCPAVSVFHGEKFVDKWEKKFLSLLWDDLSTRIAETPLDDVSCLKDEIPIVLESLKRFESLIDVPFLKALFDSFFEKACMFDAAKSAFVDLPSNESLAQRIVESRARLEEAKATVAEESDKVKLAEKKLKSLYKKARKLEASLKPMKELLHAAEANATNMEKEVAELNNTLPPIDEAKKALDISRAELEAVMKS